LGFLKDIPARAEYSRCHGAWHVPIDSLWTLVPTEGYSMNRIRPRTTARRSQAAGAGKTCAARFAAARLSAALLLFALIVAALPALAAAAPAASGEDVPDRKSGV